MIVQDIFKDNFDILQPSNRIFEGFPCIENRIRNSEYYKYRSFFNLRFVVSGLEYIKMIDLFRKNAELTYTDVCNKLKYKNGSHTLTWKNIRCDNIIEFSHKGPYNLHYYKLTPYGREIMEISDINDTYYQVVKWFRQKDESAFKAMINADLHGNDKPSYECISPLAITNCFDAIFNTSSKMHKIGCQFRWLNNIINLIKYNKEFFTIVYCPEVLAWIDSHVNANEYYGLDKFYDCLKKAKIRHDKKQLTNNIFFDI